MWGRDAPRPRVLRATDAEQLAILSPHDQHFDLDAMTTTGDETIIPFFVDDGLEPIVRRRKRNGTAKVVEVPLVSAVLHVAAKAVAAVVDDQAIGRYSLNEIRYVGAAIRIEANERTVVVVPVDRCDVSLAIEDEVAAYVTRRFDWIAESEYGLRMA